jgi:hypothetical protein
VTNAGARHKRDLRERAREKQIRLTDNEAREEGVDPAHNQTLRDHHGHVSLHHAHHAFHGRRIAHGIRSRLAPRLRVGQELALLVSLHHEPLASLKGSWREHIGVGAQVNTTDERALLADLGEVLLLGRRLEERHGVVAEDTRQDLEAMLDRWIASNGTRTYHDHCDGEQYPPTVHLLVMLCCLQPRTDIQQGGIPMDRLHHGL